MEGDALEEDRSCVENTLSEAIGKPGTSERNGPLTGKYGNASARPTIPHKLVANCLCHYLFILSVKAIFPQLSQL